MKTGINVEVLFVSVATLLLLLYANTSQAYEINEGLLYTVYKNDSYQDNAPELNKATHARYHGNRYYGYRSNRNYYRGNRYYKGNRYFRYGKRYSYPNKRYHGNRFNYRYRYGY